MALPSSARRRYPSPMIKQDLAKLGKDAESRRAALASLRSVVEEHVDSVSLPRFLQQVEDSREGRKHVGLILQDLARVHGPTLAPHIPRLLHLLVHNLLASTTCPVLLTACADAVVGVARHCSAGPNISPDDVLCQVSLPLLALLSNKIPPLSTGAATCLRVLVDSEQWRFAPPSLIENLCWKAAMAAAAPPTQTVAHINLLRSLAMSNASAISKFAPPLLRLSLDILLTPAATTSWQLRLAAVHLLESLLKAADYTTLVAHLQPSLAALSKCRRHDKLPQVRSAVLQALQTAEALQKEQSKQALDPEAKDPIDVDYHHHNDPFSSNTQVDLPSQISPSPLTSPTRLKSLSARIPTEDGPLDEIDYAFPYFCDTEETPERHEITVSNIVKQVSHPRILRSAVKPSSCLINARKSSPNRQSRVPSLKLPTTQVEPGTIVDKEFVRRTIGADQSARRDMNFESNGQTGECEVLPTPPSATRNITVLGSTEELLASCERHLVTGGKLKGQFAEAKYADDANAMIFPDAPITKNQAVNTDSKQANDLESTPSSHESEASVASVHLFNSLAHLAKVEKYQDAEIGAKTQTTPAADTPKNSDNDRIHLPYSAPIGPEASNAPKPSSVDHVDVVETSSSEWSVRDNPIAEDRVDDDIIEHNDTNSWPHMSTTLHEEVNTNWGQCAADFDDNFSRSESHEHTYKQTNRNEFETEADTEMHQHEEETRNSFRCTEFWTKMEHVRDQAPSVESTSKEENQKSSQSKNGLHFKLFLSAGLLVSIATLLSKGLQQNASGHFLPPT